MREPLRVCASCSHFYFEPEMQTYSEVTPGSNAHIGCSKDHWQFELSTGTEEELAKILSGAALDCIDFTAPSAGQ